MNIKGIEVWIILALFTRFIICEWDTAYSPLYPHAYLKLSNDELLKISNNQDFKSGDSISDTITPPTKGNFSITIANGDLYAFFEGDSKMSISRYDDKTDNWISIDYDTTLKKNTNYDYYQDCTVMTSASEDEDDEETGKDLIYIYGGQLQNNISTRILEFDPQKNTLNSVMTSITPTGFYGSSNAILDSKGITNLLIGGKASTGWVSMFQSATWEYKSWSFKTVKSSTQGINSRIHSLVLPIFPNNSSKASNVLVFGGTLGPNLASPSVLSLNVTDDDDNWEWKDLSKTTDLKIKDLLGAVVFNSTLFTVTKNSSSKKRSEGYSLNLFDTKSLKTIDSFNSSFKNSKSDKSESIQSSQSTEQSIESSLTSELSKISSANSESKTSISTQTITSSNDQPSGTITHKSSSSSKDNTKVIIPAVIVPIVGITIISIIIFFIYKKFNKSNDQNTDNSSIESDSEPDFYKEVNNLDNQSISSWNLKRNEYEKTRYQQQKSPTRSPTKSKTTQRPLPIRSPTKSSMGISDFTFDNTHIAKKLKRLSSTMSSTPKTPNVKRQSTFHEPFANPEDYQDKTELSPMSNFTNKSKISLISSKADTNSSLEMDRYPSNHDEKDEDSKIDEFLGNRDVQVLVSSKRRSKLRITNPDIESMTSISEVESGSIIFDEKHGSIYEDNSNKIDNNDDIFHDDHNKSFIEDQENEDYVREILKAFDD
ncbi:hypothetical protein BN7_2666 [Wickerhamomyces ciferrii]|uniref:Uncharacterized protein n=1 Tax=Wickerhamomyces ciferrii (strain ATCC 14091 / BCRC 22168 / CBS 111 / JCM 3599 / NBRC 0793 / NRRL Y-1031 F-60-10) TaxID=1206466 RepID=K0KNZ5_WICCF|nr:uncharacterized protein BN7_2666 [Wickerhamomyces ciferrii]CCH43119.1 hypothetical protein BN7_2666 [Wickerhamomyces ciferrii]